MRTPEAAFDLRAAMSEELRAAITELDSCAQSEGALHRCRVHVKRARALARVGRACAPGLSTVFNDTARGVMRTLGHARDMGALAETANKISMTARGKTAAALKALADGLEAERAASEALNADSARAGLKDLLALAQVWPEASLRQIRRGGERIARRARRAYKGAQSDAETARRHVWRKREKDRLYAAVLLEGVWPAPVRRKAGAKLGDLLGRERNAALLLERIEAAPALVGEGKAPQRAAKALRKAHRKLARRADALGAELHAGGA
ncbi:MAG TPA: CHAD domain-containing protein [Vitreimonas sp.]|uniref:CHAD domain-containing protein n=1 Tax=Vitreimonas sp. TaxID=3069702 RepID=UPI002D6C0AD5|nr:CHAD domain-containing protein [Vitreimonas sp.]HYD86107.1 CHAD domain-containing protein [Vitreimonas sp.]